MHFKQKSCNGSGNDSTNIRENKVYRQEMIEIYDNVVYSNYFIYLEAANVMLKLFGLTGVETYTKYATQYKSRAGKLHSF